MPVVAAVEGRGAGLRAEREIAGGGHVVVDPGRELAPDVGERHLRIVRCLGAQQLTPVVRQSHVSPPVLSPRPEGPSVAASPGGRTGSGRPGWQTGRMALDER